MIRDTDRFDESAAASHERVFKSDGRYVSTHASSSQLPRRDGIDDIASKRPTSEKKVWHNRFDGLKFLKKIRVFTSHIAVAFKNHNK